MQKLVRPEVWYVAWWTCAGIAYFVILYFVIKYAVIAALKK